MNTYLTFLKENKVGNPFLQEHGRLYNTILEKSPVQGKMKECFSNAFSLVLSNPEKYTYVEGIAMPGTIPIPVDHAWVVDRENRVVDPTWKDGQVYFGVPFKTEYMTKVALRTGVYGIMSYTNPGLMSGEDKAKDVIQKGGPGSGNFGHEGRPGLVGGSGEGAAPTKDIDELGIYGAHVKNEITKAGFKAIPLMSVPGALRRQLPGAEHTGIIAGAREPVYGKDSPQMAKGIVEALDTIPGPPSFKEEAKENLRIAFAELHPGVAAATAVGPQGAFIVVNTNSEHGDVPPNWTIANQQGAKAGGDVSTMYKFVMYHELGHVLDKVSGERVTLNMVRSLANSGVMPKDPNMEASGLMYWLKTNVSEYAAKGGPNEAAAEIVAMVYGGLPLPKELTPMKKLILGRG